MFTVRTCVQFLFSETILLLERKRCLPCLSGKAPNILAQVELSSRTEIWMRSWVDVRVYSFLSLWKYPWKSVVYVVLFYSACRGWVSMAEGDVGVGAGWVGMRRQEQEAGLSPVGWRGVSGRTEQEAPGVMSCQEGWTWPEEYKRSG